MLLGIALTAVYATLVNSHSLEDESQDGHVLQEAGTPEKKYWGGLHGIAYALRRNDLRLVGPMVGLVAFPLLLLRVWGDRGSGWDILLWCAGIAAFAALFAPSGIDVASGLSRALRDGADGWLRRRLQRLADPLRRRSGDLLPLLVILFIYLVVTVPNLTAWRYSVIGDEYLFYQHAIHVLDEGILRPFSQSGVYDNNPGLNTIYKAAIMWVFGGDHFGWKMTGVISMTLTIAGMYSLAYLLGNRTTAIWTASLFASSHYLLGLVNAGYNHTDALPTTVWALVFFVLALRTRNPLFLYLAGVLVGLGFYFHYSARVTGAVMLLTALLVVNPRQLLSLWPVILGFLMTIWPTLVVAQEEIITKMLSQSVGVYSETVSGPASQRILENMAINLPAFHFNSYTHTYVGGPLLDPVTGILAAVGLGLAIGTANRLASVFSIVWLAIAFAATGLISPYPNTAITRLFPIVPALALLSGFAAARLLDLLPRWVWADWRRHAPAAALAVGLIAVLALNAHQFWFATHREFHYAKEALAIGALRYQHCDGAVERTMFVGSHPESTLSLALDSIYPESQPNSHRVHLEWPPGRPIPEPAPDCVIFVEPTSQEAQALQATLRSRYPDGELYVFTVPSGNFQVNYFYRK